MSNKNLFKEAIADAKAVREAALANAKAALEEALTPKLHSMLNAKLNEMVEEEEDELEENYSYEEEEMENEGFSTEQGGWRKNDDSVTMEGEEEEELEEDFDLSEILAELEAENESLNEAEEEEEEGEEEEDGEEAADAEMKIADMSVEDLKDLIKDIVNQEVEAEEEETAADEASEEEHAGMDMSDMGDDEEINLEELLAELDALDEGDEEEELEEGKYDEPKGNGHKDKAAGKKGAYKKVDKEMGYTAAKSEMKEAIDTIHTLRAELNEVNLLNAKLLYVNKIFKAKNLTESQKVKVIASFDNATTPKEAKMVFESLSAALTSKGTTKQTIKENLGFASKASGVAPKQTIVESNDIIARMQKLANIKH
jgi:hypothetical protein